MRSKIILLILGILLIGGGIYLLATSYNLSNNGAPSPQTNNITIQDFAFSPLTLTIHAGDTVVWTNQDAMGHTVTSDSGGELNSSTIPGGGTYSHTFAAAGTYSYHCSIHPSMKGTIIVQ